LDAFGPLDALNSLAIKKPISLYIFSHSLDPVSTKTTVRPSNFPEFSESIVPTHTFDTAPEDVEVLLVPGGYGTSEPTINGAVEYVKRVYPSLKYLITVCTGAAVPALAGILDGKRATTNKSVFKETAGLRKEVNWVAKARWVNDGNIWTAAGVSAGLDVIFAWIGEVYGEETAKYIADGLEYDRHTDANWDPFSELYGL